MTLASGYRSYATQIVTYNGWVSSEGRAAADTASARPGYSEHQTGWAFDIGDGGGACSFQPCFAEQPAAVWAKANAHRFGFVVRYPLTQQAITGYLYESWHLRYVGRGGCIGHADTRHRHPGAVLRPGVRTRLPLRRLPVKRQAVTCLPLAGRPRIRVR